MIIDLNRITLTVGRHPTRDSGVSLMEAVAWWAGEPHSAAPQCVSDVLADYGRDLNDRLPDPARQALLPLVPLLAGTAGDGLDEARGHMALDWIVRVNAPAWLELAGLSDSAARLRGLSPIIDLASARAAESAVLEARSAAAAAWDARAAGDAARYAGDAARYAGDAARYAGDAARYAAWWGAGDAARYAAWWGAGDAAWAAAAAWAAGDAGDAGDAAGNTFTTLQESAIDLLRRMIRPEEHLMPEPLTDDQLAALRAREAATRRGPWLLLDSNEGDSWPPRPFWVVSTRGDDQGDEEVEIHVGDKAVGEFIAHARTDVPRLLAEVDRLRQEVAGLDDLRIRAIDKGDQTRAEADRLRERVAELEKDATLLTTWKGYDSARELLED